MNEKDYEIYNYVANLYHKNLLKNSYALEYITQDRKINIDTIVKMKIGYADNTNLIYNSISRYFGNEKNRLYDIETGIDFLGYYIKPTHTLVRRKVVKRFKKRLYECRKNEDGLLNVGDIPMVQSYLGHLGHANSYNLRKKLLG